MKTIFAFLTLALTLQASASSYEEYDTKALRLLTYVMETCPKEMAEALQVGEYVSSAVFKSSMGPDGYYQSLVLETSAYGHPMMPSRGKTATLIISQVASRIIPADAGPQYETTCEVKRVTE